MREVEQDQGDLVASPWPTGGLLWPHLLFLHLLPHGDVDMATAGC